MTSGRPGELGGPASARRRGRWRNGGLRSGVGVWLAVLAVRGDKTGVKSRVWRAERAGGAGFRVDVEGMRAVAILAVVGFHAGYGGFRGGFVGVDVFYVLSGFLITGLLWRQLTGTGHIRLVDFYARRVRRLLPAAVFVVVATVIASAQLLSPLAARTVFDDALSALCYVANYRFALQNTSYLTSASEPSPLQHYWSLGVEEQFYLIWPVLLVGAALWAHRRQKPVSARSLAVLLACLAAGSLVLCWWLTSASQPWAFFSLPTRAWELAVGGLLALAGGWLAQLRAAVAAAVGWLGLAIVVGTAATLSPRTAFPGTAALAPVLGTAGVLVAGSAHVSWGPRRLLATRPLQWLGRYSYTWYLWHWPVLVLAPALTGGRPGLAVRTAAVLISLLLAVLTSKLVERPIRFSPLLAHSQARSLAAGGALMAIGIAVVLAVSAVSALPTGHGVAPVARAPASLPVLTSQARTPRAETRSRRSALDPLARARAAAHRNTAAVQAALATSLRATALPKNLDPPLATASTSEGRPFTDGCFDEFTDAAVHLCRYGDTSSARTVAVFGDSHAMMWFAAFDNIARHHRWRLEIFGKSACPPLTAPLFSADLGHPYHECEQWRAGVLARLRSERAKVVVLAMTRNYGGPYLLTSYSQQWLNGLAGMIHAIRAIGAKAVVLGPVPQPSSDVPSCVAANPADIQTCALPAATALNAAGIAGEAATARRAGGAYQDIRPWFCSATTCPVVVDNLLVFRDRVGHITVPYASFLTGPLDASLYIATRATF